MCATDHPPGQIDHQIWEVGGVVGLARSSREYQTITRSSPEVQAHMSANCSSSYTSCCRNSKLSMAGMSEQNEGINLHRLLGFELFCSTIQYEWLCVRSKTHFKSRDWPMR